MPFNTSSILKHNAKGTKANLYEFVKDIADTFRLAHYHLVPEGSKKTELKFNIVSGVYTYHVMCLDILLNASYKGCYSQLHPNSIFEN